MQFCTYENQRLSKYAPFFAPILFFYEYYQKQKYLNYDS